MFLRNAASMILAMSGLFSRVPVNTTGMAITPLPQMKFAPRNKKKAKARSKTTQIRPYYRSGLYPHSSKRQQARYARQIAAGQLHFMPVHGVPDRSAA